MKKGFTLLFAVLFMSLLLTIGLSIISLSYKQAVISTTGAQSQSAFYAADAGMECAVYWDEKGAFPNATSFQCAGQNIIPTSLPPSCANCTVTSFTFNLLPTQPSPQATVNVTKDTTDPNSIFTEIDSYGHNIDPSNNPRSLERALRYTYTTVTVPVN